MLRLKCMLAISFLWGSIMMKATRTIVAELKGFKKKDSICPAYWREKQRENSLETVIPSGFESTITKFGTEDI